jgi:oligoendopeptidase F
MTTAEATAADVSWDLDPLLENRSVDGLLDEAQSRAGALESRRGTVGSLDAGGLRSVLDELAGIRSLVGRAESFASLRFAADTSNPEHGALLQKVQEQTTVVNTALLFFDLEWAAVDDDRAEQIEADPALDLYRHHLESIRKYRDHLLSEAEERVLAEKQVTGRAAWVRLFDEQTSAVVVRVDGDDMSLGQALSKLFAPDRALRQRAADAVTEGLAPGLRTRAYIYNTLLADKAVDDRLRKYDHWLQAWNMGQEASDESVEALVQAVRNRYDIPQRWYRTKAQLLGIEKLADYDRNASVADDDEQFTWDESRDLVLECYRSFSDELGQLVERFFDDRWIDAPVRPGKAPGAFCNYTVPEVHPYVMVNFTGRRTDVLTLAHELGHGVHGALARPRGVFSQMTPLTLAETASVFGETIVLGRLLARTEDPGARLALLAESVDGAIATVFRQTAMNRFEHLAHTTRRGEGELSVDRLGELWYESQTEMMGDSVELTDGYRTWWSYIPHFIGTPGYVYAYAYGQLLALSVYRQNEQQGPGFVGRYLDLLRAGGSLPPEELARIVDCDLTDPAFWDGGLSIIDNQLADAEAAAREAGRL